MNRVKTGQTESVNICGNEGGHGVGVNFRAAKRNIDEPLFSAFRV